MDAPVSRRAPCIPSIRKSPAFCRASALKKTHQIVAMQQPDPQFIADSAERQRRGIELCGIRGRAFAC